MVPPEFIDFSLTNDQLKKNMKNKIRASGLNNIQEILFNPDKQERAYIIVSEGNIQCKFEYEQMIEYGYDLKSISLFNPLSNLTNRIKMIENNLPSIIDDR